MADANDNAGDSDGDDCILLFTFNLVSAMSCGSLSSRLFGETSNDVEAKAGWVGGGTAEAGVIESDGAGGGSAGGAGG